MRAGISGWKNMRKAALAVGVVVASLASVASAVTVTFQQGVSSYSGTVDTFLHAGSPTADNSAAVTLIVDGPTASPPTPGDERHVLLRFDGIIGNGAGQVPPGATINSATLTVNITNASASGASLHRMLQTWAAADNWNTWVNGIQANGIEAASATDVSSLYNGSTPSLFNIDVTASVTAWAAGASNFGWVWLNNAEDSWQFDSLEGTTAGNRPKLSVTYNESGGGGANLVRQPYLQLGTPTSMTVCWRTDVATDSRVQYGTVQGTLNQTASVATIGTDHIVTITGLTVGTKYFYNVGSTTTVHGGGTANHYFKTSPTTGSTGAMRFWVVGDSGTGSAIQSNVMNAMLTVAGASPPDFALHVGDIAYNSGTDAEFTSNHFTPFANVLRNTVMWPSLGNHEASSVNTALQTGPYYSAHVLPTAAQAGGVASGTEAYYSFDYGNAHFIALDSQDSSRAAGGPMLTWLANDMAATSQQWLIAYWHHPPYTAGSHNSQSYGDSEGRLVDMRETVLPILEAGGVDLVLSGHSHSYERSYLIDEAYGFGSAPDRPTPSFATLNGQGRILDSGNGRPAPGGTGEYRKTSGLHPHEGTVYVVAGHGAQGGGGSINHPVMFYSELNHGSCIVDINGGELTLRNIRDTGTISDNFKIIKGQVPPRVASTTPNRDSTVGLLNSIAVTFTRPVSGVSADDLTVNGSAATNVSGTGAGPYTFTGYTAPGSGLVNVVVATGGIQDTGAPNLAFEGDSWTYTVDTNPPTVTTVSPPRSGTVGLLSGISVTFSKPVVGVVAGNMTVNGSAATVLSGVAGTAGPYVFSGFADPAEGAVSVVLAAGAIVEANGQSLPFAGDSWSYTLKAQLVINEFLSSNNSVNPDPADGDYDDWIEVYNPGSQAVNMGGMFLTDDLDFPTQFQIPANTMISAGGYLIFWCDAETGQTPGLHTNFNISRTGEDLGLFDTIANGNQLIDGFTFPSQTSDVTSGRFPNGSGPIGVLSTATPGATNGGPPPAAGPLPIVAGDSWKYFKGTSAPPTEWIQVAFDDNGWSSGNSGFGYGDTDDATVLSDMMNGYTSVYIRRKFSITNPGTITGMTLTVDYDDAFVAYLNGVEVARSASMGGTVGVQPAFNATAASGHECSVGNSSPQPPDVINISAFISQLQAGNNVLAIVGFNDALTSSDLSLIPSLSATSVQCTGAGDCNDNNPCTTDSCNSGACVHTPVSCPGGQNCNTSNGQCESTPVTVTFQEGQSGYTGTHDTYLDQTNPATAQGALDTWRWDTEDPSPNQEFGLIRFSNLFGSGPGQIPPGAQITSATLTLSVFNSGTAPGGSVHDILVDWDEATATWNTFGGDAGAQADEYGATTVADAPIAVGNATMTVTSSLQTWLINPGANRGWIFVPQNNDGVQVRSSEYATLAERPKLSVTYIPAAGCTTNEQCDDGNACTTDVCNAGTCTHTPITCNDSNACTTDSCSPASGCVFTPVANGTSCSDGNACNGAESCQGGNCTAGTPLNCDDGLACTVDSCNSGSGCIHTDNCPSGSICNHSTGNCDQPPALPIAIGATWKYFKGTAEPSTPLASLLWAQSGFDDSGWLSGQSGFGYGDGDDATSLSDMNPGYASVYIRKAFTVANPAAVTQLTLTVDYDDAYIAYINGVEVKRSASMGGTVGTPTAFNVLAPTGHEASAGALADNPQPPEVSNPSPSVLVAGVNVLAIHGHNQSLTSSDFSLIPSLTATTAGCVTPADCNDNNACTDDTCNSGTCSHTNNSLSCDDGNACTTGDACSGGACAGTPVSCPPGQTCNGSNGLCEVAPQTVSFQNGFSSYGGTVDTFIDTALGSEATASLIVIDGSPVEQALLRFDNIFGSGAGQIPAGSTISSATLTIWTGATTNDESPDAVNFHRLLHAWSDTDVWAAYGVSPWNASGGVQNDGVDALAALAGTTTIATTATAANIDVTTSLQAWSSNPSSNFGWAFLPTGTNGLRLESAESTTASNARRPKLSVTFIVGCQSPTDCNDNNACTSDACTAGSCVNTPISCDDSNPCTVDACDSVNGCSHTPIVCNDNNPCTNDTCVGGSCQFTAVTDGTSCTDGNACNGAETCQAGTCTPGTPPNCNDGNPCTVDLCDNVNGCQHTPILNGTPCPNGTVCDGIETCQAGVCSPGTLLTCDDGLFCNGAETCNAGTGCQPGTPPCSGLQQCDETIDQCRSPRMFCQLASSSADPGTTVTMDVFLEDVRNVRGYQTQILITPASGTGTVSVNCPGGVAINQSRPDFVFSGLGTTFPAINCPLRRAAAALLSGSATVNTPKYVATYTLTVSNDATAGSTFNISIMTTPDSALTDAGNQPIPFAVSSPCSLMIGSGKNGTVTVNLTVPGLNGGPAVSEGQPVAQRAVEFLLTHCPGDMDARSVPVNFTRQGGNGVAQVVLSGVDVQATWLAIREGHSLRKRVPINLSGDFADTVSATLTMGDFQTPGVPQDGLIDITDFAILAARYNTPVSDCMVADPAPQNCSLGADVTGDGQQNTPDFTAILINFFQTSESIDGCPPPLTDDGKPVRPAIGPITKAIGPVPVGLRSRIRVADLRVVPNIANADLNRDSVIDAADVRLFARRNGLTLSPDFERKLQSVELSNGAGVSAGQ